MATAWFVLIVLCLLMYVVLDGYDLGIGVATLFERDRRRRYEMLELVAPAWDGNETWLVLLIVSLWAGFPLAFGMACLAALNGTAAPLNLHGPGRAIAFTGLLLFVAASVVMALVTLRPAARDDSVPLAGLVTATMAPRASRLRAMNRSRAGPRRSPTRGSARRSSTGSPSPATSWRPAPTPTGSRTPAPNAPPDEKRPPRCPPTPPTNSPNPTTVPSLSALPARSSPRSCSASATSSSATPTRPSTPSCAGSSPITATIGPPASVGSSTASG
jgi:hypothetical protein